MQSLGLPEEYLCKAKEAETRQRQAKDATVKESWERIIVGYLELADIAERRDRCPKRGFPRLGG